MGFIYDESENIIRDESSTPILSEAAGFDIYSFLSKTTADSKTLFSTSIIPQHILTEVGEKNVIVYIGDDGSEKRVALDSKSIFRVRIRYDYLSPSDAGVIVN